jgi:hypothetical protein
MRSVFRVLAIGVATIAALAASGCRGQGPTSAPCATVGARFATIAAGELAAAPLDEPSRRRVAAQLPALGDALTARCDAGGWSAATRNCLAAATDHGAFQACAQALTEPQRRALEDAAAGDVTARSGL